MFACGVYGSVIKVYNMRCGDCWSWCRGSGGFEHLPRFGVVAWLGLGFAFCVPPW